ncbi:MULTISPECIES: DUF2281 domain-containing protein [Cyanophyceae]|uniref:DUF2281 domain-containing protein n=1 Tax=Cyanophyceae TaxID=3028117 RepID=UPI00232B971A|nr:MULTISPECIES: DUF2281 domain-containing protein [Cyanophyceae]MDB9354828.1 DUF2281 domain-containing protein [Nodularia spumigena CS-587/03]MDB9316981.1 DUF2281 domain-containing protein [Nodularia spumigena CS-590/01A]MDB9321878.1 DUF2281 domain-containing protein [Nodularia spumigena CS-591/07A]MDB9328061.1 DUF2281 domain-containing protein [Nodularia spumigena CS-590/02]MDB9330093.1 DUF2281 domain-containing protein [Nodularia spumigena CS-591/04]
MKIRDTAIAKLQNLSEPLIQEVSDFIDFIIHKYQAQPDTNQPAETIAESWSQWFKTVDCLDVTPPEPVSNYQQLLLEKYRQQGLEL